MHEQNLSSKIEEIYSILDEIQLNQVEMLLSIQKNQSIIIKKIEKLQEYNEIDDMNNSLFDQKLTRIEEYCKG
ncbi:unknown [Clostridium sp. CAG:492]|nr:unknown [Clostridium sp. CAG:492]